MVHKSRFAIGLAVSLSLMIFSAACGRQKSERIGDEQRFADREMIFEPFWRKSEATPGTGLGLAIAKELTELHRGQICKEYQRGEPTEADILREAIGGVNDESHLKVHPAF